MSVPAFAIGCERGPQVPDEILMSRDARAAGATLFKSNCAICHGENGDGRGLRRAGFDQPPPDFRSRTWRDRVTPGAIAKVIRNGKKPTSMPAWPSLSERQIDELVAYLWSLSEARDP